MMEPTNIGKVRPRGTWIRSFTKMGSGLTLAMTLMMVSGCPMPPPCTTDAECSGDTPRCRVNEADPTMNACVACLDDADCDDTLFCNGTETCGSDNTCQAGTEKCTEADQMCDEDTDACLTVCSDDSACDDGLFCNGSETCGTDGVCQNGSSPCSDPALPVCDEDNDTCVECLTDDDCDTATGQTCDAGNTCQEVSAEFSVSIDGCPSGPTNGVDIALSAMVSNASDGGQVTFSWSAPGGGFDDDTAQSVVFNSASNATVTVTAQDNTVVTPDPVAVDPAVACMADGDCGADEVCFNDVCSTQGPDVLTPLGTPVTATCDIVVTIETTLTVDAGADRAFPAGGQGAGTPPLSDFPGAYPGAGATLRAEFGSGAPTPPAGVAHAVGRIYKDLTATASDPGFDNAQLTFLWECVSAPDPATCSNVTLLDPTSVSTGFLLSSVPTASLTTLKTDGQTTTLPNIVVPGQYTFRVTVANPNGDTGSDTVVWTITPGFAIPTAAGGSLEGMTLENGQVTNRVARPNSINVPFTALARSSGTVRFLLTDTSNAADALTPTSLNEVSITPSDPPATTSFEAMVTSANRGTFTANAQFESGEATVPSAPTGLTVHVQNAVTGAIDTNASTAGSSRTHFGQVNSTNLATVAQNALHGARAVKGGNDFWDGEVVIGCDVNGDGFPETITADGNVLSIMRGNSTDPSTATNSPFANAINNNGTLDEGNAGVAGTLDSFALSNANMTGTDASAVQVTSLCCGDFDGDGNMDIAVGDAQFDAGGDNGREGRILIFYGQGNNGFSQNPWSTNGNTVASGALLVQPRVITRTDGTITGIIDRDDQLGYAMVCCDVNNDGFDDIIAGAPGGGQTVTAAASGVLVNDAGGASTGTTLTVDTVDATTIFTPGDICVVDSNNTAFSYVRRVTAVTATQLTFDIAIGTAAADNETVDEIVGATGAVFGILGNSIRLPNSTTITDTGTGASFRIIPNSSVSGDLIGASLSCGDVNADGIQDIVFGAPGRKDSATASRVAAGTVFVTFGRGSGLSGNINTIDRIFEGNVAGLGFGRALGCCNWNGSGGDDLVVSAGVGATLGTVGTGRLYFIDAATGNIQSAASGSSTLTSVPTISGGQTDSNLGTCLACWEFSGDNNWDILVAGGSATAANQQVLLIDGSDSFGSTVSATATFTDSDTTHTLLSALGGVQLWPDADGPLDVDGALFTHDGCGFVDTNGDKVLDLFFQGDTADAQNVDNAYCVMGAE